ncbi:MAG: outer membrane protein assembly factor BamD [Candidatus Marinimicrobia bacterium]|nr:outer membrane protein assembly factor BamD [Candidatus Neomarinimicrobiota bacterium]
MKHKIILICVLLGTGCVYFNTFYNAEQSFAKAVRIIDESSDEEELPTNAKNLLNEAFANSEIVIQKYPESKYVDDAFFIMGKSSFFLGDYGNADKYLNRLIYEIPNSTYKDECEIWLTYTQYKMGNTDSALAQIQNLLDNPPKKKNMKYLLYKTAGDIALSRDSVLTAFNYFETAARLADNSSKRMSLYNKMVLIAEKNKDYEKAIYLLEQLELYGTTTQVKQEARLKWIEYNRILENYDQVLLKIDELLLNAEFQIHHLTLKVEKAKIFLSQKDYSRATDHFKEILEDTQNARKDATSEAAFHLGNLALIDGFDLDLSLMYLDSVTQIIRNSTFRTKASQLKTKVTKYQALVDDLDFAEQTEPDNIEASDIQIQSPDSLAFVDVDTLALPIQTPDMAIPPATITLAVDSLLFTMAEMLLFEFNRPEISMAKYRRLVTEFPDSKFASQALYVLHRFSIDDQDHWKSVLIDAFPESVYAREIEGDSPTIESSGSMIEKLRDLAWMELNDSPTKAVESFDKIANEFDDPVSAYNSAYISEKYQYLLETSIERYQSFLEKYPEHEMSTEAESRLEEIKSGVQLVRNEIVGLVDRYTSFVNIFSKSDTLIVESSAGEILFSAAQDSVIMASFKDTLAIHFDGDSMWTLVPTDSTANRNLFQTLEIYSVNDSLNMKSDSLSLLQGIEEEYFKIINLPDFLKLFPDSDSVRYKFYDTTVIPHPELDSAFVLLGMNEIVLPDTSLTDSLLTFAADSLSQMIIDADTFVTSPGDSSYSETFGPEVKAENLAQPLDQMVDQAIFKANTDVISKIAQKDSVIIPVQKENVKEIVNDPTPAEAIPDMHYSDSQSEMESLEYVVKPGENLQSIAQEKYNDPTRWRQIYNSNINVIGDDPNKIYPYYTIKLDELRSSGKTYVTITMVVQPGENLWSIAEKYYGDPLAWSILWVDNKHILGQDRDVLIPGSVLNIRSKL